MKIASQNVIQYIKRLITITLTFLIHQTSFCQLTETEMLDALQEELMRNFEILSKLDTAVYHMSLNGASGSGLILRSGLSSMLDNYRNLERSDSSYIFAIHLRMGSIQEDQFSEIKSSNEWFNQGEVQFSINLKNVDLTKLKIKKDLWKEINKCYWIEKGKYNARRIQRELEKNDGEKKKNSYSLIDKSYEFVTQNSVAFDSLAEKKIIWQERLKDYNDLIQNDEEEILGEVRITATKAKKIYISSEKIRIVHDVHMANLLFILKIFGNDKSEIPYYISYVAESENKLPSHEKVKEELKASINIIKALKHAPLAEPFAGPAIFTGSAAAVLFHEVLGHRIESHRLGLSSDAKTFLDKLDKRILPQGFNVQFDPTIKYINGHYLSGNYSYDDEGVKTQKVDIVKNGILVDFLRSRRPLGEFHKSNGHGRTSAPNYNPVTRQSNMIISSDSPVSDDELRKQLIIEINTRGLPYGYLFEAVSGGHTFVTNERANTIFIDPIIVKRVYANGKADELVRGVKIIGTPLTMFENIKMASSTQGIFSGYCGAESGGIPVSAVCPSLLISLIETQRNDFKPIPLPRLPRPNKALKKKNKS